MVEISSVSSKILEDILNQSSSKNKDIIASERLQNINEQMANLPTVLDSTTLQKLKNGEYEISLKEYSDLNTYRLVMDSKYGNKSADKFQNYINNIFEKDEEKIAGAKKFIEKMRESGMSDSKAAKLYSALKTYSLVSSFRKYNFVNAKI